MHVRHGAQAHKHLHGLVRGAILAQSDGVVGEAAARTPRQTRAGDGVGIYCTATHMYSTRKWDNAVTRTAPRA